MAYDDGNIFAKILRGEAPAFTVYEDDYSLAFMDVMPQVLATKLCHLCPFVKENDTCRA